MKVYTSLLIFGVAGRSSYVLADSSHAIPTWILTDGDRSSLDVVKDGFYNISGVGKNWLPPIERPFLLESFDTDKKETKVNILYVVYFPQTFDIANTSYGWKEISKMKEEVELYKIIRYIYGNKDV